MDFHQEKIASVLGYLADGLPQKRVSKLFALKLVYLADRYHLRKYGCRSVTEDEYWAMTYGPVPSKTKRLIEDFRSGKITPPPFLKIEQDGRGYVMIVAQGLPDMDIISATDKEAMDAALGEFAKHDSLIEFVHQFPEWKRHQDALAGKARTRRKMSIGDFFEPAPATIEYCDADAELVALNRDCYIELA